MVTKSNTLQERFGFSDSDLKKPDHDRMMIWLDNNIVKIVSDLYPYESEWNLNRISKKHIDENVNLPEKPDETSREVYVTWEHPIMNRQYTIGFIDMLVTVKEPEIWFSDGEYGTRKGWEFGLSNDGWRICFEVKTEVPSLGELIRQIHMYKTYLDVPFYVVSPDGKFADQLRSQNIGFVKYP